MQHRYVAQCHPQFFLQYLSSLLYISQSNRRLVFRCSSGRCMAASSMCACLFCRQWRRRVMILTWVLSRVGYNTQGASSLHVWSVEDIACDVDEVLWSNSDRGSLVFFFPLFFFPVYFFPKVFFSVYCIRLEHICFCICCGGEYSIYPTIIITKPTKDESASD